MLLHLGDHDPSGIDMSRDNASRLNMFSRNGLFQLKRLALNYDQVEEYSPPPNPAKTTDTRYEVYRNKYGEDSWELDALDPTVIQELIMAAVLDHRDDDLWEAKVNEELIQRATLARASSHWDRITKFLEDD